MVSRLQGTGLSPNTKLSSLGSKLKESFPCKHISVFNHQIADQGTLFIAKTSGTTKWMRESFVDIKIDFFIHVGGFPQGGLTQAVLVCSAEL